MESNNRDEKRKFVVVYLLAYLLIFIIFFNTYIYL